MNEKILVPIDLAHESSWKSSLPRAFQRLRDSDGVQVTVMTVVPDIFAGLDWRYAIRGETGGSEEFDSRQLVAEAEEKLQQIVREYLPEGCEAETLSRYGTVYQQIIEVAEAISATEIMMAAHRPSLRDYLIGPNTARVVRHAQQTVTVVRDG